MGTNIMANQVKTPIQNYFEKVLYENLTFLSCGFFRVVASRGIKKNRNKPLWFDLTQKKISKVEHGLFSNKTVIVLM